MGWRDDAACAGHTDLMFVPITKNGHLVIARVREAMAICNRCPVKLECRVDAAVSRAYVDMGCVAGGIYWPARSSRHGQWPLAVLDQCPCLKCSARRQREVAGA